MRFTAQEEFGLRCLVSIARREAQGTVTIQEISKSERITPAYAGKLLRVLRRAGLIEGRQGSAGGYRLARPAAQTNLGDALEALGGRLFQPKYCERFAGEQPFCVHTSECSIRSLWAGLDLVVGEMLRRTSLADLVSTERSLGSWIRAQVPAVMEAAARAAVGGPARGPARPLPVLARAGAAR